MGCSVARRPLEPVHVLVPMLAVRLGAIGFRPSGERRQGPVGPTATDWMARVHDGVNERIRAPCWVSARIEVSTDFA